MAHRRRCDWLLPRRGLGCATGQPSKWHRTGAFGEVAFTLTSRLAKGEVLAEVGKLARPVQRVLLRVRVPDGWRIVSAQVGREELKVDQRGTVELFHASASRPALFAGATVRLAVQRQ